jgi:hypothetical protein
MVHFCIGVGMFKGLVGFALLRAGWSNLPNRKGLVSGVVVSGMGFGGFLFGKLFKYFFNYDNIGFLVDPEGEKYLPPEVGKKFKDAFTKISLIYASLVIVGLLLVNQKKVEQQHSVQSESVGLRESIANILRQEDVTSEEDTLPLKRMILSRKFIAIYVLALFHIYYGYFFGGAWKIYGKQYIDDDAFLTNVGAFASLANGVFKFIAGNLMDYFSFRTVYGILNFVLFMMIISVQYSVENRYAFFVVTCIS